MRVSLVGNQNSGKTSLFNVLTGTNQKVGNWPGVTIEHKSGIIKGTDIEIVDLPGIYSLSPYTAEEEISRKFVMSEKPEIIINIVDITSMERSLYLTTQLLELDSKVIVALNMCDLLEKKGLEVNEKELEKKLGCTVIKISALKKEGITELIDLIRKEKAENKHIKIYDEFLENQIEKIEQNLECDHKRFVAVKMLEKDNVGKKVETTFVDDIIKETEGHYGNDMEQLIANQRYEYITKIKGDVITKKHEKQSVSDKLDKVFLNKWLAIPIFMLIMGAIYYLAVGIVGSATVDWIGQGVDLFSNWFKGVLEGFGANPWAVSLVIDGIVAGVGAVLNFVPQLMILFFCIAFLETSGYMSRIAFFLDKIFKKFGLSGKSLIPFIIGSGCSVPAIMTTRTIEDENEKRATIMLTPFIPCSAKLPIITLFAGYFFTNSWLVTLSLYLFAIAIILISSIILRKFFLKGSSTTFISELPEFKLPSIRYILRDMFDKTIDFIKRAGTIILLCSVIIWVLLSFNWKFQYGVEVSQSMLASIGNAFAWVFYPMLGEWSWAATVSAVQGLVAKEQVVSSMAIIAGFADSATQGGLIFTSGIFSFFTGASAYAFMVFNLFSAPCFGAISAMRKELGSAKKTWIAILFQTGVAWALACLVFGIGTLIGYLF